MARVLDMTGQRIGRLVVIGRGENDPFGTAKWICQCDCGKKAIIRGTSLRNGDTRSCGCFRSEADNPKGFIHGRSGTRIYDEYRDMLKRCRKGYKNHDRYYDRGIRVCEEWQPENNGLFNFLNWAENNGYKSDLTLDRIDNDGDYSPDNCRWATRKQQANNRKTTIFIEIDGETKSLKEWCEYYNMPYNTVRKRYRDMKWDIYRALGTPIKSHRPYRKRK